MRFLIVNTDYPEFLRWFYAAHPGLEREPFELQARARAESLFCEADFYSSNLRKLGHEAWDIHTNNEFKQKAWARDNGVRISDAGVRGLVERGCRAVNRMPLAFLRPLLQLILGDPRHPPSWVHQILAAQIRHYSPDVLYNLSMNSLDCDFLREVKGSGAGQVRLVVGQHAVAPLPNDSGLRVYDLVFSSSPPTVDDIRRRGIRAELLRLAFEPRVLSFLQDRGRPLDITFVGSFYDMHSSRTALLETLCARFPQMKVFGPTTDCLARSSPIRKRYAGQAWGRDMYQGLRDSKIAFNHHGNVPPFANNYRLYEVTGVGALLVTDWKENLREMFEPGKEVVAYRTAEECIEQIRYYLEHEAERNAIARRGQDRTLRDHTFHNRMRELTRVLEKSL